MPRAVRGPEDAELSDSTRAALRLQRELEAEDRGPQRPVGGDNDVRQKTGQQGERGSAGRKRGAVTEALGDGRTRGAVTGLKLGDFGSGGGTRSAGVGVAVSGGRQRSGQGGGPAMSLESLARLDGDDDARLTPEAPLGAVKRQDLERALEHRAKSQRGLDGKVYDFMSDPESDDESVATDKTVKEHRKKKRKKEKGVGKKKKKRDKEKAKRKKHKKKKCTSSSSMSSS
mmetsp:Transcript_54/g.154  ORF Transcript_54/g.154 Transcript_54/m.154 type:complete len:229 (-) Transcript_54:271-957(-)|eukprot:CAMPEP_0194514800 /NCGR_PEP_ID=MMETSP0253-20130528/47353_1 /TAXON_ID=2966 /ORGANISM="Noctiluca scintillans" /LENGTH=228 /DNA_ID=CAMNT_0039358495 /DNA_START=76 /DNA_END=762 /DNA_ORIENTATION=-